MSRWFISMSIAAVTAAAFAASCTAGNAPAVHKANTQNNDYVKTSKPGAAVEFTLTPEGLSTDSSMRDIRLLVTEGYGSGRLTVQVSNNENLSISGGTGSFIFDMSGSQPHEVALNVKPLADGKHYLNFTAIAEFGEGQSARSYYSVPIYANVERSKSRINAVENSETATNVPGIVIMDAEETIITKAPE